ncbi:MAG: putative intron HNH endonuclease [Satyrvirus sp.]|uniref:Putative intron HNH endonuclease n=1 Tax=Satyrvirus sp. TaxID=2487771 RepID=A0A3G5AEF6_9VIRU|nr:MAG: putative intron HNH endonuclease [Satyrvirus sp.]
MSNNVKEIWKNIKIKGCEKKYQISTYGRIRSRETQKIRLSSICAGYPSVSFKIKKNGETKSKSYKIHRLVAKFFIKNDDPENKTVVNHINGNKLDNCVTNLEWVTPSQNVQHAIDNGLITITKRPIIQYDFETGKAIKKFESVLEASKEIGVNDATIINVCNGKRPQAGGFGWEYEKENPNSNSDVDLSEYKQIVGFPNYVINNEGKIYSLPQKKF